MLKPMHRLGVVAAAALLSASLVWAQTPSAVGRWKQFDDKTGALRSLVVISEKDGIFEGTIEKIFFRPDETDLDPVCSKCTDAPKGQKIVGMTIVTGMKQNGFSYSGGEILDPGNGKVYRAKMTLSADGTKLEVRGFIGFSLFGRSQMWRRE